MDYGYTEVLQGDNHGITLEIGKSHSSLEMIVTGRLNSILRFPEVCNRNIEHLKTLGEVYQKYSLGYWKGFQWIYDASGKRIHFLEGEENLVLYYDERPFASIGFKALEHGVLIYHLQGVLYDKLGVGHKNKKKYYPDLSMLNWRDTLVSAVEEIARLYKCKNIYLQPASVNSSIGGRTDEAERNYDGIADRRGYTEFINISTEIPKQDKNHYWVKELKSFYAYKKHL